MFSVAANQRPVQTLLPQRMRDLVLDISSSRRTLSHSCSSQSHCQIFLRMFLMDNSTAQALSTTQRTFLTSPVHHLVIAVVVLVLLLLLAIVLRYMYQHKGTYHTNEAKGTEFAETADAALRGDPALQDATNDDKKEYFI
ncbi:Glycophorin-C Glycoconnectin [Triplophysa tibetana]|uniref:Glycophorin-C Glycoconnectin n=1 Tax=Triplophysa tibetana TaxID=1572043 RepID=A0A5A9P543_9TELE|nr:Glycophorin-C Glycoconnectin [Triplophysa tibetana]